MGNFRIYKNIFADYSLLMTAAICVITGNINLYYVAFSAIVHELAHYGAACMSGLKPTSFVIKGFGIELGSGRKRFTHGSLAFVSACGPAANFILAYVAKCIGNFQLFVVNISIGIINLLPALPLDGGQILYGMMCSLINRTAAKKIARIAGRLTGTAIILAGMALLIVSKVNFSLLYIGIYVFFASLSNYYNPVVELEFIEEKNFGKCHTFALKDSMRAIDAANALPHNGLGAVKDENGQIYDVVSPYYLYNKLKQTDSAATLKTVLTKK